MAIIIPTYNGAAIFGVGAHSRAKPNPPRIQWCAYNGLAGRERISLGPDGWRVEFTEFLQVASDLPTLGAYESIFWNLIAFGAYATLVDTLGVTWLKATLTEFEPLSVVDPYTAGGCSRTYRALFEIA